MTTFLLLVTVLTLLMGTWTLLCTIANRIHFSVLNRRAKKAPLDGCPLVSVIIPARNEEDNLGRLLSSLTKQTYRNIEILVINDGSSDGTQKIIEDYERKDSRIKGFRTSPSVHLSNHGKINALLQLIPQAKGEYLLCTDADTEEQEDCIETALRLMRSRNADILSGFPAQYSDSNLSRLLTTCMGFAIIALPVIVINGLQIARFSIGIGQFIMMRRSAYEECGGYMAVRNEVCDDIGIIKNFMRHGKKYVFTAMADFVNCHMYGDGKSAFRGLERSICNVFPSTVLAFVEVLFIVVLLFFAYFSPLLVPLYLVKGKTGLLLLMLLGWTIGKLAWYIGCRDLAFKRRTAILSTSSIALIIAMYLHGMWMKTTGRKFYWKGRKI